jgi:hypothetical protein
VEPSWELVSTWRELLQINPRNSKYWEDFLGALRRSASLLRGAGRSEEVAQLVTEAIAIGRQMWEEDPKLYADTYSVILITTAIVAEDPTDPFLCRNLREALAIATKLDAQEFLRNRLEACSENSTLE